MCGRTGKPFNHMGLNEKNYMSSVLDFANNPEHFAFYLKVLSCLDQKLWSFKITCLRECCFEEMAFKVEHTFFH